MLASSAQAFNSSSFLSAQIVVSSAVKSIFPALLSTLVVLASINQSTGQDAPTTPAAAADTPPPAAQAEPADAEQEPADAEQGPADAEQGPADATEPAGPTAEPAETGAEGEPAADPLPKPADVTAQQAAQILLDSLPPESGDGKLRFNFSGASWGDVLDWFAEQADLSLHYERAPEGSVNFRDPTRTYTPSEGLDILNRLLLDRGYALVRRGRMLLMVDLEVENASNLISEIAELVSPDDLDGRGRSDIVSCIFPLGSMTPEDAQKQLNEMRGPWGRVIVLDSARQAKVTETVEKLRAIRSVLEASKTEVVEIILKHRGVEEVLEIARPLLDLEPGENTNDDIRITYNLIGDRIYATGLASKISILQSLVEKVDNPLETSADGDQMEAALPVFQVHVVQNADITSVFEVLQTLLQGQPDTNIAIEPSTKSIIARARPEVHNQIEQTIAKMDGRGKELKVVTLRRLDPSQALLTINKYFGITEEGGEGPVVDGDPVTGKLWIRGTSEQIAQVEQLIRELEGDDTLGELSGKVRVLPFTGRAAEDALQQVQTLWPVTGRPNQIRTITPARSGGAASGIPERRRREQKPPPSQTVPAKIDAGLNTKPQHHLVVQVTAAEPQNSASQNTAPQNTAAADSSAVAKIGNTDIVVQVTPAGIIIASEDTQALDAFQSLLESVATPSAAQSDLPTIFWLKYAKADETAELIASVLGGAESTLSSMGDSLMGGLGGGMLGGLMGLAGGGGEGQASSSKSILTSTGSVSIVADARLNALFVQANPVDLQVIEMILEKVDQPESPEDVEIVPKPLLIPVIYHSAKEIADVVKSLLGDRIAGAQSGGGNRGGGGGQPSPQDFINALRGGGGRGGNNQAAKSEAPKISLSVDERSNSLIVIATPQDFEEIRELVVELDEFGKQAEEIVQVVEVPGTMNAEAMVEALEALLGTKVTTASASTSTPSQTTTPATPPAQSPEDIRARIEAFRARFGGGGGPFGGTRGGGGGSPFGGARPGGGGGPSGGARGGPGGGRGR